MDGARQDGSGLAGLDRFGQERPGPEWSGEAGRKWRGGESNVREVSWM
jgi:hypothetical protein